jgi:UDP-2,3-diacylglucosamine pyrophosphatase LpxH
VFDVSMQHSKWLAKLGGHGYDLLIVLNRFVNFISIKLGRGKISLSKRVKDGVKSAVKFIGDFEKIATDIAIANGYNYVICGHIHQPQIRAITTPKGTVTYLNSGDWVENLTALEFNQGKWSIYEYNKDTFAQEFATKKLVDENENKDLNIEELLTNQVITGLLSNNGSKKTNKQKNEL